MSDAVRRLEAALEGRYTIEHRGGELQKLAEQLRQATELEG